VRWFVLTLLVVLPAVALAKPKVAVAPLEGDPDGKITAVLVDAADDHATVTRPTKVEKAMDKLSLSELNKKALKKLRIELEVEVIVHGKVDKVGGKKHLSLVLSGKGKKSMTIDVTIGPTKTLKKDLSKKLDRKIDEMTGGDEDPDEDEQPKRFSEVGDEPKKTEEEDRPKKKDEEDRPKKKDEERPKKRVAEEDARKSDDEEDEGGGRKHRKKKHHEARNPMTAGAVWVDVGAEIARRTLTWSATGMTQPPSVGTAAPAGRIGGEIYPFSFDTPSGGAAGLGFYGDYARTVGLSIQVPGSALTPSIKDGHYQIGARYRFVFGDASAAVGGAYWRRWFKADRSTLTSPDQLDMPDVDYTAFALGGVVRFAATPTVSAFASADLPLVLDSGPIGTAASYGRGTILAFDISAGAQILLGPHYALQIAGAFNQVGISFAAAPNSMAATRAVTAATDRSYGLNATIGILY